MFGASTLYVLLVTAIAVTAIFVLLMILKSLSSITEEDVVILNEVEAGHAREQQKLIHRVENLALFAKGFGIAALVLYVAAGALYIYQGLQMM